MILSLPLEILLKISAYVAQQDRLNLRLTCKTLDDATVERIFSSLCIDISAKKLIPKLDMLHQLAQRETNIWRYVKSVVIQGGDPKWHGAVSISDLPLKDALLSLENATTLSWVSYIPAEWELFQILTTNLPLLPRVRDVTLNIYYNEPYPRPQYLFRNLTSLTANFSSKCSWRQFYKYSLLLILHHSPDLTHLKLANPAMGCGYASFDKVIEGLPSPMRITDFTLGQLTLPAPSLLLRHFRFLSAINLTETSSGNLEDLWTALSGEHIHLLKIRCDKISEELFDYLLSYDGLQSLMLRFEEDSSRTDALATVFFSQVLPHHHKTITRLVIEPQYEGLWSYSEQTSAAVFQCTRLRFLWMTLRLSQLSLAPQLVESAHLFKELEELYMQCPSSFSMRAPEPAGADRYEAKNVMEDMIVGLEVPPRDPYRWLKVSIEPLGSTMKTVPKNGKFVFELDRPFRGFR